MIFNSLNRLGPEFAGQIKREGPAYVNSQTSSKEFRMNRIFIAASVAAGLVASVATADAGSRHKHHHVRGLQAAPVAMRPVGPPWAGPNLCFTDEGYGRYASCDSGRSR